MTSPSLSRVDCRSSERYPPRNVLSLTGRCQKTHLTCHPLPEYREKVVETEPKILRQARRAGLRNLYRSAAIVEKECSKKTQASRREDPPSSPAARLFIKSRISPYRRSRTVPRSLFPCDAPPPPGPTARLSVEGALLAICLSSRSLFRPHDRLFRRQLLGFSRHSGVVDVEGVKQPTCHLACAPGPGRPDIELTAAVQDGLQQADQHHDEQRRCQREQNKAQLKRAATV